MIKHIARFRNINHPLNGTWDEARPSCAYGTIALDVQIMRRRDTRPRPSGRVIYHYAACVTRRSDRVSLQISLQHFCKSVRAATAGGRTLVAGSFKHWLGSRPFPLAPLAESLTLDAFTSKIPVVELKTPAISRNRHQVRLKFEVNIDEVLSVDEASILISKLQQQLIQIHNDVKKIKWGKP